MGMWFVVLTQAIFSTPCDFGDILWCQCGWKPLFFNKGPWEGN